MQFRRASNKVTTAEQLIDCNTKKLENGGRNVQQTTDRIDQARRDLESARAEYTTLQTTLQEAQGHLEGDTRSSFIESRGLLRGNSSHGR